MGWMRDWFAGLAATSAMVAPGPRAMAAPGDPVIITTPAELEEALRRGNTVAGQAVTPETAMRVTAVFACVSLRSKTVGTIPFQVKRRVNDTTRVDATDHSLHAVLTRKPNKWQKPREFKKMMQAHVLLRGNAYAKITRGIRGEVLALTPLHPDRVQVEQNDDLSRRYEWTRKDGAKFTFQQDEILHLMGLSLDGVRGVSPITYARQTLGLAMALEAHGTAVFGNGAVVAQTLKIPKDTKLKPEHIDRLKADMEDFRSGGAREGKVMVLEDGLEFDQLGMSIEDAAWIDSRKFSRSDIAMLFAVPPHMIGDTEKSTSWGTGIDSQTQGYVTFSCEDDFVMWEEGLNGDCLDEIRDANIFVRINRQAMVRGDIKTRWGAYVLALQWGVMSPNEVRALEDMNPREGGDVFYPPPNMTAPTGEKPDVFA